MPSHRDLQALAGVYALDALDDRAEHRRFTRHLRRCPACAEEVRGFQAVATALALAAAAEPPPELHERVMAAVGRTRQLPPVTARPRLRALDLWTPPGVWLPRLAMVTAAVAVVAVIVLSIALSGTRQQLSSARAQLHSTRAQASSAQAQLNSARAQLNSDRARSQAIAVVLAAGTQTVTGSVATGGKATVLLSVTKRELVVSTSGLAALPAGKAYQLWLIGPSATQPTAIRSAGLLPPAVGGLTSPVPAPGLVAGDKLAMTVEPAGGTNQPTTTPILLLSLPVAT